MDDSVQFVPRRPTSLNVPGPGPLNNSTIDLVSPDRNATVDLVTPSDGQDTKPLKLKKYKAFKIKIIILF